MNRNHAAVAGLCLMALCTASCSFNRAFFQPDAIPPGAKGLTAIYTHPGNQQADTVQTLFTGPHHQPVFVHNRDTTDLGYDLESVVFTSTNGHHLNGWMMTPRHTTPGVTLLHLHGNAGNLYSQYQFMQPLVRKGFRVFVFDYSGYGFSTGKAGKETVLQDALSALDYVKAWPGVQGGKLVIYGQSMGGHLSAVVAAQRQQAIDGLVVEGAFSSMGDIAAHYARHAWLPGFVGRLLVTKPYAATTALESFRKPVLIVHSTDDKVIPYYMGTTLYQHAHEPKRFYKISGPHIQGPMLYTDSIAHKIMEMLQL